MADRFDRERAWRRYDEDEERYRGRYGYYGEPTWRGREYGPEGYYYSEPTYGYGREGYYGEPSYGYARYSYYGEPTWRGTEYGREGRMYGEHYGTYGETWTQGPYAGRGPRGYQRSDERIREDVNERLTQHGQIDATEINVTVNNGEVTLEGTVDSRQAKRMAEDTAESVMGVRDVHNRLQVRQREQQGQMNQQTQQGQQRRGQ
ncbi:MAG: BON domain-containing protein [Ardenticatenaceae bacterium]|nr:BON domain-containing protein [Ardenticatenaceae bacterium]